MARSTARSETRKRGSRLIRLAAAERGRKLYNLWQVWSYKRKKNFLLPSDPALFHFSLLEADLRVQTYELEHPSLTTQIGERQVSTRFDACVTFKDATVTWDEVKYVPNPSDERQTLQREAQKALAEQYGIVRREFSVADLVPFTNRVLNCLRMLQTIRAAGSSSLAGLRTQILAHLLPGPATLASLRQLRKDDEGLMLAAAFCLILEGAISADIDSAPLSDFTALHLGGDNEA